MNFEKEEYEIQHYGFSIRELILQHQLLVKFKIEECFKMFTDKLLKRLEDAKATSETITAITKCAELTTTNIYDSFKEHFTTFELLVDKYFHIPNNIILPDNFKHQNIYTEIDEENLEMELDSMEKTFKENCYMLIAMEAENQMYKTIESIIEKENDLAERVQETFDDFNKSFGKIDGIVDRINLEK